MALPIGHDVSSYGWPARSAAVAPNIYGYRKFIAGQSVAPSSFLQ